MKYLDIIKGENPMVNSLISRVCRINIWYLNPDIVIQCEYIITGRCVFDILLNRIFDIYYQFKSCVLYCSVIQACKTVKFLYMKKFLLISCTQIDLCQ